MYFWIEFYHKSHSIASSGYAALIISAIHILCVIAALKANWKLQMRTILHVLILMPLFTQIYVTDNMLGCAMFTDRLKLCVYCTYSSTHLSGNVHVWEQWLVVWLLTKNLLWWPQRDRWRVKVWQWHRLVRVYTHCAEGAHAALVRASSNCRYTILTFALIYNLYSLCCLDLAAFHLRTI